LASARVLSSSHYISGIFFVKLFILMATVAAIVATMNRGRIRDGENSVTACCTFSVPYMMDGCTAHRYVKVPLVVALNPKTVVDVNREEWGSPASSTPLLL